LTRQSARGYTSRASPVAEMRNVMLRGLGKPIRTVLKWQLLATVTLAVLAGVLTGEHGVLSAALGGAVSISAGWTSAVVAASGKADSAVAILVTTLIAEGVKVGLIVVLLLLVLAVYAEVVLVAFIGSFVATVLIFLMAILVREHVQVQNEPRS